jgi:hypothetical protein
MSFNNRSANPTHSRDVVPRPSTGPNSGQPEPNSPRNVRRRIDPSVQLTPRQANQANSDVGRPQLPAASQFDLLASVSSCFLELNQHIEQVYEELDIVLGILRKDSYHQEIIFSQEYLNEIKKIAIACKIETKNTCNPDEITSILKEGLKQSCFDVLKMASRGAQKTRPDLSEKILLSHKTVYDTMILFARVGKKIVEEYGQPHQRIQSRLVIKSLLRQLHQSPNHDMEAIFLRAANGAKLHFAYEILLENLAPVSDAKKARFEQLKTLLVLSLKENPLEATDPLSQLKSSLDQQADIRAKFADNEHSAALWLAMDVAISTGFLSHAESSSELFREPIGFMKVEFALYINSLMNGLHSKDLSCIGTLTAPGEGEKFKLKKDALYIFYAVMSVVRKVLDPRLFKDLKGIIENKASLPRSAQALLSPQKLAKAALKFASDSSYKLDFERLFQEMGLVQGEVIYPEGHKSIGLEHSAIESIYFQNKCFYLGLSLKGKQEQLLFDRLSFFNSVLVNLSTPGPLGEHRAGLYQKMLAPDGAVGPDVMAADGARAQRFWTDPAGTARAAMQFMPTAHNRTIQECFRSFLDLGPVAGPGTASASQHAMTSNRRA